jgi:hypothetical protein
VIEVVMGVDDVADGLVGELLPGFRDHRQRALLVKRRLDHRNIVLELDG